MHGAFLISRARTAGRSGRHLLADQLEVLALYLEVHQPRAADREDDLGRVARSEVDLRAGLGSPLALQLQRIAGDQPHGGRSDLHAYQ